MTAFKNLSREEQLARLEKAFAEQQKNDADPTWPMRTKANDRQVGGDHYKKKGIQPWEVIEENGMGFFDGNALKYLMRYKDKGGVDDLRKAIHYIEKLIELETGK